MSDSNWLGILGGFWLANQLSEEESSNSTASMSSHTGHSGYSGHTGFGEYKGSSVKYFPEDEKTRARNFVHRYVTDGKSIYTQDEFCIFVTRAGVIFQEGLDDQGLPSFNIYQCKKKNSLEILQNGTFWSEEDFWRLQRRDSDKVVFSLARKGFPIHKNRFRVVSKFDLLKEVYPETFRVLSREESYYYWRSQR